MVERRNGVIRMPAGINVLGNRRSFRIHLLTEGSALSEGGRSDSAVWPSVAYQCPTCKPFVFSRCGNQMCEPAQLCGPPGWGNCLSVQRPGLVGAGV